MTGTDLCVAKRLSYIEDARCLKVNYRAAVNPDEWAFCTQWLGGCKGPGAGLDAVVKKVNSWLWSELSTARSVHRQPVY